METPRTRLDTFQRGSQSLAPSMQFYFSNVNKIARWVVLSGLVSEIDYSFILSPFTACYQLKMSLMQSFRNFSFSNVNIFERKSISDIRE